MQKDLIKKRLNESSSIKIAICNDELLLSQILEIATAIVSAFNAGNAVYFCGNGGSAADAQHLAAEFSGRFYIDRKPLPSEALHCNSSFLTAVANDYGYNQVYSRLIEAVGKPGDILVGISTSGNSENILKAFDTASAKRMITVALAGQTGGKMADCTNYIIKVPSTDTARIQEAHITVGHIICEIVETAIFAK